MKKFYTCLMACFYVAVQAQWTDRSVLADGEIFVVETAQNGVHTLRFEDLTAMGYNGGEIQLDGIQIFMGHVGMLPEANLAERVDDLIQLPISGKGLSDGRLSPGDEIWFYATGPDKSSWNSQKQSFEHQKNIYSDVQRLYVRIGNGLKKEIIETSGPNTFEASTEEYIDYQHFEIDELNLLHFANNANLQGSGKDWFGDVFSITRTKEYSDRFDFRNRVVENPIRINVRFAGRDSKSTQFSVSVGDQKFQETIRNISLASIENAYAQDAVLDETLLVGEVAPTITIEYPQTSTANVGWLDWIGIEMTKSLVFDGAQQQTFQNPVLSLNHSAVQFNVGIAAEDIIWDITDVFNPLQQVNTNGSFNSLGERIAQFITFNERNLLNPTLVGRIDNQNIHSLFDIDYLIIYHESFEEAAVNLNTYRQEHNGFKTAAIPVQQVYNEFSSGKQDPTAIRNLARMLYKRENDFHFLVLIGDGSFDHRHRYENLNNESFIPAYETDLSFDPVLSFPTDDYYALLSDQDGADDNNTGNDLRGALDIAVGRWPVKTSTEANLYLEKIKAYETDISTLGDWRLNVLYVADDGDDSRHIRRSDEIAVKTDTVHRELNLNKVFIDAFEEEVAPGGVFNPKSNEAINQNVFRGQLVVNYIGHGGSTGWAQERILKQSDIDTWNNLDRLPLIITATCSFAGYDNPAETSAGEYTLIKPDGGAVALFTTVRSVYASQNERLTRNVFNVLFERDKGRGQYLGDILMRAKNSSRSDTTNVNARKFTLLGDPAMRLGLPEYQINTLDINGVDIESFSDTMNALEQFNITGEILRPDGTLASDFNGTIEPTIYDKKITLRTLGQFEPRGNRILDFEVQNRIIFNGLATVNAGKFEFSFVVPEDIDYSIGNGKISYYAQSELGIDASGQFEDLLIGGSKDGLSDDTPPEVNVFLETTDFIDGDITSPNPLLIINLKDDNGINTTGTSIGHDLSAWLDGNREERFILNSFYQTSKDDFREGQVLFPLSDISPGEHTLTVKAWDIANNSIEQTIRFVVEDDAFDGIRNLKNFPNPVSDITSFEFEHSFTEQEILMELLIFDASGKLVEQLEQQVQTSSGLSREFSWDASDANGRRLDAGVYYYQVAISNDDGFGKRILAKSDFQKILIAR